jgi:ribosomal protein L29
MIDIKLDIDQLDGIVRAWLKETLKTVEGNAAAHYVHPEDAKTYKKDIAAIKWVIEYIGED